MLSKCLFLLFVMRNFFISSAVRYLTLSSLTDPRVYNAKEMPRYITADGRIASVNVTAAVEIYRDYSEKLDTTFFSLALKLVWSDPRLKYRSSSRFETEYFYTTDEDIIWFPRLMLSVEEHASIKSEFVYFYIYPNSTVVGNIMQNLEVKWLGPVGSSREIRILIMSLNYTSDRLKLEWDIESPLEMFSDYFMEDNTVHLRSGSMNTARLPRGQSGDHSCLKIEIINRKYLTSAVLTVYIPAVIAVTISWIGFWMEVSSVLGRAALLLACLLHLFIQKVSIEKDLSLLENLETLDLWLEACIGFVFAAFFEMVCVTVMYRYGMSHPRSATREEEERSSDQATTIQEEEEAGIVECRDGGASTLCNHFHFPRIWLNRFPSTADAINAMCRVVFPLCFVVFLCAFFIARYTNL